MIHSLSAGVMAMDPTMVDLGVFISSQREIGALFSDPLTRKAAAGDSATEHNTRPSGTPVPHVGRQVRLMTESAQQAVESQAQPREEEAGAWQTPGYVVIDTALEVTAYSLSNR